MMLLGEFVSPLFCFWVYFWWRRIVKVWVILAHEISEGIMARPLYSDWLLFFYPILSGLTVISVPSKIQRRLMRLEILHKCLLEYMVLYCSLFRWLIYEDGWIFIHYDFVSFIGFIECLLFGTLCRLAVKIDWIF